MAARTNSTNVEAILVENNQYDGSTTLTAFIDTATSIVDEIAANDSGSTLDATRLELIERWLAAHCYKHSDQMLEAEKLGDASGKYQGQTAMALDSTQYGQMAKVLDTTGFLANMGRRKSKLLWLGRVPSDQKNELTE